MIKRLFVVFLALLPIMIQARRTPRPEDLPPDSIMTVAVTYYQEGRFRKAAKYFDYYVLNYPVREDVPYAQFHLARSYFEVGKFEEAAVEFEFCYKQFPASGFAEQAQYWAAEATFEISEPYYHEQNLTLDAKRMAEDFLARYPDSELAPEARDLLRRVANKLARKELEAAKLYFKFKEYGASISSLEYTLATYPDARETNREVKYYLALCKAHTGQEEEAKAILEELREFSSWEKKATKALEKLKQGKL